MKGVVLAAGFGTRLYPLTRDRAKPLLPVGGRPVVERVLERLLEAPSVDDVVVVTNGRFEDEFRAWLEELPSGWRSRSRLVSDGVTEPEARLGAVRDLRLAAEEVGAAGGFVVAAGDNLFDFPVEELVGAMRGRDGAGAAVAVGDALPPEERAGKGLACVDSGGRVTAFEEKPTDPTCDRPAAAVYAFRSELPGWIDAFLDDGGEADAPGFFLEWLVDRGVAVAAYPFPGYRFDVGTPERYREARAFFGE